MRYKSGLVCLLSLAVVVGLASCGSKTASPTSSTSSGPALLFNYPATQMGGDYVGDGLDITSYPGTTLSSIVLWISSGSGSTSTNNTFTLAASVSCFGGTAIGTGTSGTVTFDGTTADEVPVTFAFSGNPSVTKTVPVALVLSQLTGATGTCYLSEEGNFGGLTGAAIGVDDLNNTSPCLSTVKTHGFAILLYGNN